MTNQKTIFFDIGGVLLTNGWDTSSRKRAAEHFELEFPEFQTRHEMLKTALDVGSITLQHYIKRAIFHRPRNFTEGDFEEFMKGESKLLGDTLEWVRELSKTGKYRLFTLNNESRELHEYRVRKFNLEPVFEGFLCSCYLGQAKPDERIYLNALGIASCDPADAIFIDDRGLNVEPAHALGLNAVHFQGLS